MKRTGLAAGLVLAFMSCTGVALMNGRAEGQPETSADGGPVDSLDGGTPDGGHQSTGGCTTPSVFAGLKPTCEGCHGVGTNRPYFVSEAAFSTLVTAPWVVPGQPQQSALLQLLAGQGQYTAMPLAPSAPFSELAAAGKTSVSMETLTCWIAGLAPATTAVTGPLPVARRLSAEQLVASLRTHLNIEPTSLFETTNDYVLKDPYAGTQRNFQMLGGPSWRDRVVRTNTFDPPPIQMWVLASQAYCQAAESAQNSVLFKYATRADTAPDAIKKNLAYLGERLLSVKLSPAEVDDYFALFQTLASTQNRDVAWTGVCAAFLRDPLYLTY